MSDPTSASPPTAPASPPTGQAPKKKHSPARLLVLLVILLLVTGAFFYDRKVAGPACEEGFEKARAMLEREHGKPGAMTAGCAEMQAALGKKPAGLVDGEHYAVERYTWRRGSLFQTYFVCVIYRKHPDGKLVLESVMAANEEPGPNQLPGAPIVPQELTEEQKAAMSKPPTGPSSGPPGPGPGPGPIGKPPAHEPEEARPEKPDATPAAKPDTAPPEKSDAAGGDKPAPSNP